MTPASDAFVKVSVDAEDLTASSSAPWQSPMGREESTQSTAWDGVVQQLKRDFEKLLVEYHRSLGRALSVPIENINYSAYPAITVFEEGGESATWILGDELFVDLFVAYSSDGWRGVEKVSSAVAVWSKLNGKTLTPLERNLPAGVDISLDFRYVAAEFYRDTRQLLGELVLAAMRDVEQGLLRRTKASLQSLKESLVKANREFAFQVSVDMSSLSPSGQTPNVIGRMKDSELAESIYHYHLIIVRARKEIELAKDLLSSPELPPGGGARGGTGRDPQRESDGSGGGSGGGPGFTPASGNGRRLTEPELRARITEQEGFAVNAARQLQLNVPWSLSIISLVQVGHTRQDVEQILWKTLAEIENRIQRATAALAHDGCLEALVGKDAREAILRAYPAGIESLLVHSAYDWLNRNDASALHLLSQNNLLQEYEQGEMEMGIQGIVLGQIISEVMKFEVDRAEAEAAWQATMQKVSVMGSVFGLLSFIPVGGAVGIGIRAIEKLADIAILLNTAHTFSEELDLLDKASSKTLVGLEASGLQAYGEILGARQSLEDEELSWVLFLVAGKVGVRLPVLKQLLFVHGLLIDVKTVVAEVLDNGVAAL